ncbi:MAG: hypothetical protein ACI83O_000212 [Patescibacteria group bacterium]|jgi:hypothetical protein
MSYSSGRSGGADYAGMYASGDSVYGELRRAAEVYTSQTPRPRCPTGGHCAFCTGLCKAG